MIQNGLEEIRVKRDGTVENLGATCCRCRVLKMQFSHTRLVY